MDPIARVFLVDDDARVRSLLKQIVEENPEFAFAGEADNATAALEMLPRAKPDLILMDVEMPGMDGVTATRLIMERFPSTRVIAWTRAAEPHVITEMVAAGACGYLLKGTSPKEITDSLRWAADGQSVLTRDLTSAVLTELTRLYRDAEQRAQELHDSYLSTVASLAAALETKDDETGNHARRVRDYAAILTRTFDPALLENESLLFGFLLHDIGKIGIPEQILTKPGPLSDEEWAIMRTHPTLGARILENSVFLQPLGLEVVLSHHERWDGQGYPHRISREEIPIGARLFAVVDAFDAMTSDRPYRRALSVEAAIAEIDRCEGSQFDPDVVRAFHAAHDEIAWRRSTEKPRSALQDAIRRPLHVEMPAESA